MKLNDAKNIIKNKSIVENMRNPRHSDDRPIPVQKAPIDMSTRDVINKGKNLVRNIKDTYKGATHYTLPQILKRKSDDKTHKSNIKLVQSQIARKQKRMTNEDTNEPIMEANRNPRHSDDRPASQPRSFWDNSLRNIGSGIASGAKSNADSLARFVVPGYGAVRTYQDNKKQQEFDARHQAQLDLLNKQAEIRRNKPPEAAAPKPATPAPSNKSGRGIGDLVNQVGVGLGIAQPEPHRRTPGILGGGAPLRPTPAAPTNSMYNRFQNMTGNLGKYAGSFAGAMGSGATNLWNNAKTQWQKYFNSNPETKIPNTKLNDPLAGGLNLTPAPRPAPAPAPMPAPAPAPPSPPPAPMPAPAAVAPRPAPAPPQRNEPTGPPPESRRPRTSDNVRNAQRFYGVGTNRRGSAGGPRR